MWHRLAIFSGPALAGFTLGLAEGPGVGLFRGALLAVIVVGCALMMLPALYVATTLAGHAPPLGRYIEASTQSMQNMGLLLMGFTPGLAFLVSTATETSTVVLLGHLCLGLTLVLALKAFYQSLFQDEADEDLERRRTIFVAWSLVALGIGEHFFWDLFATSGALYL